MRKATGIGYGRDCAVKLGIVVNFRIYRSTFNRVSTGIGYLDFNLRDRSIVCSNIYLCKDRCPSDDIFCPLIISENPAVH